MADSLILADEARAEAEARQLALFFGGEGLEIKRSAAPGDYTGDRVFRDRPEIYRLVVSMRAEGISIAQTSRACHVTERTVKAIEEREGVPITEHKKHSLKTIARANRLLAERIEELAPTATLSQAAIGFGITFDKLALGTGDPTSRLEITKPAESIFERMTTLAAELTQAAGLMGLNGENAAPKATAAPGELVGSAGYVAALPAAGAPALSDVASDAFPRSPEVNPIPTANQTADPTTLEADMATRSTPAALTDLETPAGGDGGGRGSPAGGGVPFYVKGEGDRNFDPKGEIHP